MNKGHQTPARAAHGLVAQQPQALLAQALHRGPNILHLDTEMVYSLTLTGQKLGHGALVSQRLQKLDLTGLQGQETYLDALILHRLGVLKRYAQAFRVEARGVMDALHRYPYVIDACHASHP
jgi:hypothetical protein